MKRIRFLKIYSFLSFLFFINLCASSTPKKNFEKGVVELTQTNFDSKVSHSEWIVLFIVPWDSENDRLLPTWKTMSSLLEGKTNMGIMDCSKLINIDFCKLKEKIETYPLIKM